MKKEELIENIKSLGIAILIGFIALILSYFGGNITLWK